VDELLALLGDYLEEIDAVIEADDGTLIPYPLLLKHERMKEALNDCRD
jgi:hypothetical protein